MRSLERGTQRESLDASVARIAASYGFTMPAVPISRRAISDIGDTIDHSVAAVMALMNQGVGATQSWGIAKKGTGTTLSFSITGARHAVSHALVVKTALSIAELSGFTDLAVGVSSVGDAESRRRFTRELGTFFKKNADALTPEVKQKALHNPDEAYRMLLATDDPLAERLPRPIDYLSENSRKVMTDSLALFESVGIPYTLASHLPATPGVQTELLFAISGVDRKGERTVIAQGGRFDEFMKKKEKSPGGHAVGISLTVPEEIDREDELDAPQCFIIHVGEAAKMRSFSLIEALWRANIAVREALMAESLKVQMDAAKESGVKYIAIIGQREALDGTVIVRSTVTQMQSAISVDKLVAAVSRKPR
jgi:histidyl-tRNA synthetase